MDRSLENKLLYLILFFSLPLLFFPKINLLSFENQTAGVRIDDLILFGLGVFLLGLFIARNRLVKGIEKWVFWLMMTALFSFFINRTTYFFGLIDVKANIFYVLRLPEYFVFFFLGAFCARVLDLKKLLIIFVVMNAFIMLLQKGGILGQFTSLANFTIDTNRVSGIASFPSEMGALLNMIFCYFLYKDKIKNWQVYTYFIVFFILIILTGSRFPLLVSLLVFVMCMVKRPLTLALACLLITPLAIYFVINNESILERSLNLFSIDNLKVISRVWDLVDTDKELYDNIQLESKGFDLSWLERLFKWCFALKLWIHHPECYLLGLGPGCLSSAVDGGFIRILTENGLIGLFLYYKFFQAIYSTHSVLKWVLFAFLMNMFFFDIYLAYKPMALLLLMAGYYHNIPKHLQNLGFRENTIRVH
jgi:hypothetical protein